MKKKRLFYNSSEEILSFEKVVYKRIEKFLIEIKKDKILSEFILSFWIVWPCARWQGFWYNYEVRSDVDFYVLTSKINPKYDKYLKKSFNKIFESELDCGILIWNKNRSYKRPDLMFYEYISNWKFFYWDKPFKISFDKISKFEVFRNLIYRSHFFLRLFVLKDWKLVLKDIKDEMFLYYYSKIIFSIEEVILILNWKYIADNFKRKVYIQKSVLPNKLWNEFLKNHNEIFYFRYKNKIPNDFDKDVYIKIIFNFLNIVYDYIFLYFFNSDISKILLIHPNYLSMFSTRIFYSIRYWNLYKKIRLSFFSESFIVLTLNYYHLIKDINLNKNIKKEQFTKVLELCKVAPWFYYKI